MFKKISILIPLLFMLGCATTPVTPTEQAVMTYEDVGFTLSVAYTILAQMEQDGSLTGEKLIETKKMYNDARTAFLAAGSAMRSMVESPDPIIRADARNLYRQSLLVAANIAMQLSKILGGKK